MSRADPAIAAEIAERAEALRDRLAVAGTSDVDILAVTKGFGPEVPRAAVEAGFDLLGENYAQELEAKAAAVGDIGASWHFVGRLQRNKVRRLSGIVARWDSVDRPELASEIAKRCPGARILVQVNVSEEPAKGGCEPGETATLVDRAGELGLTVEGLMTVGRTGDPEESRPGFRKLRRLCDDLGLAVCSMGMSGDLEVAVAEGSTMIRVGTALFGPRPAR